LAIEEVGKELRLVGREEGRRRHRLVIASEELGKRRRVALEQPLGLLGAAQEALEAQPGREERGDAQSVGMHPGKRLAKSRR
jgi:hypothetical protein